jgi:glutamate synthase domain-containing protein 2
MSFAMENINCEFLACRLTNKTDMKYNNETHHNHPQIHHEIGATKNDKASQAAKKNRIPFKEQQTIQIILNNIVRELEVHKAINGGRMPYGAISEAVLAKQKILP